MFKLLQLVLAYPASINHCDERWINQARFAILHHNTDVAQCLCLQQFKAMSVVDKSNLNFPSLDWMDKYCRLVGLTNTRR